MPYKPRASVVKTTKKDEATFAEIVQLISASRNKALQAVNTVLIDLYWEVGATISRKIQGAEWGDGVVEQLDAYIARSQPGLRGFTRANLFRMRQFYETYQGDKKVAPLVRQLPWPHHPRSPNSKRLLAQESYKRVAVERRLIHNKIHKDFRATLLNEPLGSELKLTTATVRIVT